MFSKITNKNIFIYLIYAHISNKYNIFHIQKIINDFLKIRLK